MSKQDEIVYRYTPVNEGDSFRSFGIPVRDLTQADVDKLSGSALANLSTPGPSGKLMYTKVLTPAEEAAANKAAEEAKKKAEEEAKQAAEAERKAAEEAEKAAKKAADEAAKAQNGA